MTSKGATTHLCPGLGCGKRVPNYQLACRDDWYKVSAATRDLVNATWPDFTDDPMPYMEAREQAVMEMNRA